MTADGDGVIGGHFYIFFEQIYDGIISRFICKNDRGWQWCNRRTFLHTFQAQMMYLVYYICHSGCTLPTTISYYWSITDLGSDRFWPVFSDFGIFQDLHNRSRNRLEPVRTGVDGSVLIGHFRFNSSSVFDSTTWLWITNHTTLLHTLKILSTVKNMTHLLT